MPEYFLPCECGAQTVVSPAQAGQTVHCRCGITLQVPTMRGLRELEAASDSAAAIPRPEPQWDDRHRVAFLLALGAVTCLLVAAYLWFSLPQIERQPTAEDFAVAVDSYSTAELLMISKEAVQGLDSLPIASHPEVKIRQMMLWGIGIVLVLAVAAAASAAVVATSRPTPRK
jgi:hypothetical protein